MENNSPAYAPDNLPKASDPDVLKLAGLVSTCAPRDGRFELGIPGAYAIRRSRVTTELVYATVRPALCIVAQGAKRIMLGQEVYHYDPSHMLIFSVDLPVTGEVLRASLAEPFLAFMLDLDAQKLAELVLRVYPRGLRRSVQESRGVYVCQIDLRIVNAAIRLLELLAQTVYAAILKTFQAQDPFEPRAPPSAHTRSRQ